MREKISITNEEIYNLREQGFTYEKIAKYFKDKGIKVSSQTIGNRSKEIYQEKGRGEPNIKSKNRIQITDEEIYNLRKQEFSYEKIAKYFRDKGIKVGSATIRKRCKEIYQRKGKEEPKAIVKRKNKIQITDEEIYNLREQGFTYEKIAKYFKDKGIKVSSQTIGNRSKEIYQEKGRGEPNIKSKNRIQITDEEIYNLRKQEFSYEKIAKYFRDKGIKVSSQTIGNRCKEIYQRKGKREPNIESKNRIQITDEEIYNLREQGFTYEKIAKYFKDKGIKVSGATIGNRCKRIYKSEIENSGDILKETNTTLANLERKIQIVKEKKKNSEKLLEKYKKLEEKFKKEYERLKKNGEEK